MQIFVNGLTGQTSAVVVEASTSVSVLRSEVAASSGLNAEEVRLVFAGLSLCDEFTLSACGITDESTVFATLSMDGGAKKRKKKVFTKPKKNKHKHRKNKLGILKCYKVEADGKVTRVLQQCPHELCGAGAFMAKHYNRHYCGKCSMTQMIKGMEGVPPPKPAPKAEAETTTAAAGKAAAKKKK